MNYYNPYFYNIPSAVGNTQVGLFSRLFGNFSFSGLINGTQRFLNFANQAIPFVKQVKPMIGNAKTMFRVMNEFKRTEKPNNNLNINKKAENSNKVQNTQENYYNENGPKFFM